MASSTSNSTIDHASSQELDAILSKPFEKSTQPAAPTKDMQALFSHFLDKEIGEPASDGLAPDLTLRLLETLKEVGLKKEVGPEQPKEVVFSVQGKRKIEALRQEIPGKSEKATPATISVEPSPAPVIVTPPATPEIATPAEEKAVSAPMVSHPPPTTVKKNSPLSIMAVPTRTVESQGKKKAIMWGAIAAAVPLLGVLYFLFGPPHANLPFHQTPNVGNPPAPSAPRAENPHVTSSPVSVSTSSNSPKDPGLNSKQADRQHHVEGMPLVASPGSNRANPQITGVSTWSPAESLGTSQTLPAPMQTSVKEPDLPLPVAPRMPAASTATPVPSSSQGNHPPDSRPTLAEPLSKVLPVIPDIARKTHMTGVVRVLAKISAQGKIIDASALSGPQMLRKSAEMAVRQWIFKPAQLNGANTESEAVFSIEYK